MKTITIRLPEEEKQPFEEYCASIGRTQTDVLREFIRSKKTKSRPKTAGLESH
jgi:predicted DNA-binding protein